MRNLIISCPDLSSNLQEQLESELATSYGEKAFVEVLPNTWLLRCDASATSVHQFLEKYLTKDVDFIIYELAEDSDFVQNVDSKVSEWTDVNF